MMGNAKKLMRIFFLVLYALYALTPVTMYAMAGGDGTRGFLHARNHASADIVWANVLFSFFIGADEEVPPSSDPRIIAAAQPGGDVVLIKKRRALSREPFDFKPLFDMKLLPPGGFEPRPAHSSEFSLVKNPLLREACGCLVLNTGLSPPSLLS
jgi:hypothetical protein